MSHQKRNELMPRVSIKKFDNTSDSDESIMLDGTSKGLTKTPRNVEESSTVVSSTLPNTNKRNNEFHVNRKSVVTKPKKKCVTISSTTKLVTDVVISSDKNKILGFQKNLILALLVATVILVIAACFTVNYLVTHKQSYEKQRNDSVEKFDYSPEYKLTTVELQLNFKFGIIPRSEWKAQKPKSPLMNLRLPSTRIIIAHTVTSSCLTRASCSSMLRAMQNHHFQLGYADISYNFLVGGDGSAYVGRGWNKKGAHSGRYNHKSICIAFIGTFTDNIPPQRQIKAAQKLIKQGLLRGKLSPHYRLYGHRQVLSTQSPGNMLYEVIKDWDHWSNNVV